MTSFQCDFLEVKSQNTQEVLIEADGEFLGTSPVVITNLPKKLLVFGVNTA
jgi:diacylglycerol kinase family enzyme